MVKSNLGQTKVEYSLILVAVIIAAAGLVSVFNKDAKKFVCRIKVSIEYLFAADSYTDYDDFNNELARLCFTGDGLRN